MELRKIERLLILGYYLFEKRESVEVFSNKISQFCNSELNVQNLNYELTKIRISDPNQGLVDESSINPYYLMWYEYDTSEKLKSLKSTYLMFNRRNLQININAMQDDLEKQYPEYVTKTGLSVKRDTNLVSITRLKANYQCEINCGVSLFQSKNNQYEYTEVHHLIPLKYQAEFEYSLDIEENMVSLCPRCHSMMHYGSGIEEALLNLYTARREGLMEKGIFVSYEQILLMYA